MLFRVRNIPELKIKFKLFYGKRKHIIALLIVFILLFIPQFIYWKYITGHWVYFSYKNESEGNRIESFYFLRPHIIDGFLSFRKGWLIYTPIMIFGLGGIFIAVYKRFEFALAVSIFTLINIYVILSWWCWWYGGGFGLRAFIDSYALLALPMACIYQWLFYLPYNKFENMIEL